MNDHHAPDDLAAQLDAVGDALERPPRADARVDALLGAAPPLRSPFAAPPADVTPLPVTTAAPKRRTAWIAVAAALALLAGIGAVAYAGAGDDPTLPVAAAEDDAGDVDDSAPDDAPGPDDAPAPDDGVDGDDSPAESLADHHAWLECVTDQFRSLFADGFEGDADGRSPLEECGEPPSIRGLFADGLGFCLAPHTGDATGDGCAPPDGGWFPFGELPDLEDLADLWPPPGLDDWRSLDEVCSSESTESGVDIVCEWPPCDADSDCPFPPACDEEDPEASAPCLGFDFGFGLEVDPEGFGFSVPFGGEGHFFFDPELLPDTFPDLPEGFEFPADLPELDAWFEDFPWTDAFDGLFGEPEPADA